jgi:hypothetical protein
MHRTIKTAAAAAALGVLFLAGCGGDAAADLKKQLQDSGMSAETSDCIVKGLQSRGVDLKQYGSPSAEDDVKITEAVTECMGLGDVDLSVPDASTP